MNNLTPVASGATHQIYATLLAWFGADESVDRTDRDRGAVSLEQVLWFVAAGVSVAVIAAIVWNTIRDQANTDPTVPVAPTP